MKQKQLECKGYMVYQRVVGTTLEYHITDKMEIMPTEEGWCLLGEFNSVQEVEKAIQMVAYNINKERRSKWNTKKG